MRKNTSFFDVFAEFGLVGKVQNMHLMWYRRLLVLKLAILDAKLAMLATKLAILGAKLAISGAKLAFSGTKLAILGAKLVILGANLAVLGAKLAVQGGKLAILDAKLVVLGAKLGILGANLSILGAKLAILGVALAPVPKRQDGKTNPKILCRLARNASACEPQFHKTKPKGTKTNPKLLQSQQGIIACQQRGNKTNPKLGQSQTNDKETKRFFDGDRRENTSAIYFVIFFLQGGQSSLITRWSNGVINLHPLG